MSISDLIRDPSAKWHRESPASPDAIRDLVEQASIELPNDYLTFLRHSNGGEGKLGMDPYWFQIWRAEEVVQFGTGYQVPEHVPGCFAFGSSGGGDLLAFDTRGPSPWPVVTIPCIGMALDTVRQIAGDFAEFVQNLRRKCDI